MLREDDAKGWALRIVDSLDFPPCEIVEVLAIRTFLGLIQSLNAVPGDGGYESAGRSLLCALGESLQEEGVDLRVTVRRAMQIVRSTSLGAEDYCAFDAIEDGIYLAETETYGTIADCRMDLETLFGKYKQLAT